jgi:hypothetical protein
MFEFTSLLISSRCFSLSASNRITNTGWVFDPRTNPEPCSNEIRATVDVRDS